MFSFENAVIVCGAPSSRTWNASRGSRRTRLPSLSFTVTVTCTASTSTCSTYPAPRVRRLATTRVPPASVAVARSACSRSVAPASHGHVVRRARQRAHALPVGEDRDLLHALRRGVDAHAERGCAIHEGIGLGRDKGDGRRRAFSLSCGHDSCRCDEQGQRCDDAPHCSTSVPAAGISGPPSTVSP